MTENMGKMIRVVFAISVFAAAVGVAAITFCFIMAAQPSDEQIFQNNISKTVEIRVLDESSETLGYGTGVFVSSDGLILTNKHMVQSTITGETYSKIEVRLPDSSDYIVAELCKISESANLATIKIERQNCQYFSLDTNPKDGQQIYTVGNPNGFGLSFAKGNISSAYRKVLYNEQTIEVIQTSLVINEGNSGGAVFTSLGKMVGLISFRLKDKNGSVIQGVAFAVPAKQIISFLAT